MLITSTLPSACSASTRGRARLHRREHDPAAARRDREHRQRQLPRATDLLRLLAAVSGVLFIPRLNAGIPTAGTGYELNAIAACVIGGRACSTRSGRRPARRSSRRPTTEGACWP